MLEAGKLGLAISHPAAPNRRLDVVAGPYRFVDEGTVFQVARQGSQVELWVDHGRVAVWQAQRLLAKVEAGGHWSSVTPARTAAIGDCQVLAGRGAFADALACYRSIAGEGGDALTTETALYEAARLQSQRLGDEAGALATLRAHRQRFPRGALRSEVDLTLIELLPRVGRHAEVLEESAALLARTPAHERAPELHLLRGNILRERFGDYTRAEVEYHAARSGAPAVSDDAAFFQSVCLEALGRPGEAAASYRRYLAEGGARHTAEARRRLSALAR